MSNNPLQCPKCNYERKPTDTAPASQCPSCGVIYAKARASAPARVAPVAPTAPTVAHKVLKYSLITAAGLAGFVALARLVDPMAPVGVAAVGFAIWVVRAAAKATRQQEEARVAEFNAKPFQHCMSCGHDFKHGTSARRGSTNLEIALWILLLWPIALVYSIWRRLGEGKARMNCLVCASNQVVPATSPAAVAHKRALGIVDA